MVDAATALAPGSAPVLCGALPARGGCYGICVGTGSSTCREARDGACVMYREMGADEEYSVDGERRRTNDSMQGMERVRAPEDTCTPSSSAASGKCEQTSCTVLINGQIYCSKCSKLDEHLVDGKCVAADGEDKCTPKSRTADGTCASCAQGYFLNRGGCYKIGQAPGNAICTDEAPSEQQGECKTCALGYFKNPADVAAGTPPCIACNDTAGFTVSSGPTYKGLADCTVCTAPEAGLGSEQKAAKCTKCGNSKYLKADGSGCVDDASGCAANTEFAKADPANGNRCIKCGDATSGVLNCAKCTAPTTTGGKPTCSECGSGYKLEGGACVSSSTNKSGLSTGVIAGISVAAVVVIGGLVGFLCWWFVCRGKA